MWQGDIQVPPVFNFCLNFGIFLGEVHKAISHGAVLQTELKGADEQVIMDSDYADDLAVMNNTSFHETSVINSLFRYSAHNEVVSYKKSNNLIVIDA